MKSIKPFKILQGKVLSQLTSSAFSTKCIKYNFIELNSVATRNIIKV